MNRECNGDFFTVGSLKYYRCLQDGSCVAAQELRNGDTCPHCGRKTDGQRNGKVKAEIITVAILKNGVRVELP